jgi:hypothetical protein
MPLDTATKAGSSAGAYLRLGEGLPKLLIDGEEHHITNSILERTSLLHDQFLAREGEGDVLLPPSAEDLRAWLHFVQEDTQLGEAACVQALKVRF